jgi:hypothetical protein
MPVHKSDLEMPDGDSTNVQKNTNAKPSVFLLIKDCWKGWTLVVVMRIHRWKLEQGGFPHGAYFMPNAAGLFTSGLWCNCRLSRSMALTSLLS